MYLICLSLIQLVLEIKKYVLQMEAYLLLLGKALFVCPLRMFYNLFYISPFCNLLVVSRLSKDSNCRVVFCASLCEFQDLNLGMMIGSARLIDNLYYFDDNRFENKQAQGFIGSVRSIPIHDQIILWHNRLGHPHFFLFKTFVSRFI